MRFCQRVTQMTDATWCAPQAVRIARAIGMSERRAAELAIVVSELVTNAVKYAGGGELTIQGFTEQPPRVEVIVADEGPGIADLEAAFTDGYSAGHVREPGVAPPRGASLGTGLGAVRRLSDELTVAPRSPHGLWVRAIKRVGP